MSYYLQFPGASIDNLPTTFTLNYNCYENPKVQIMATTNQSGNITTQTFVVNEDLVRHRAGEMYQLAQQGNTLIFGNLNSDKFAHVRLHYDHIAQTLEIERGYASKIGIIGIIGPLSPFSPDSL